LRDFSKLTLGFLATTAKEFAQGFADALNLSHEESVQMRRRARRSAQRFSEQVFKRQWCTRVNWLLKQEGIRRKERIYRTANAED